MFVRAKTGFNLFQDKSLNTTRFGMNKELGHLTPIIHNLHTRTEKIKIAANKTQSHSSPETIDSKKYNVLKQLMAEIDDAIMIFNSHPAHQNDYIAETREQHELVKKLIGITSKLNLSDRKILATKRNDDRENVNSFVQYGPTALTVATATFLPMTFPAGIIATYATYQGSAVAINFTGLDDMRTRSTVLIDQLDKKLAEIDITLTTILKSTPAIKFNV